MCIELRSVPGFGELRQLCQPVHRDRSPSAQIITGRDAIGHCLLSGSLANSPDAGRGPGCGYRPL